MENTSLLKPKMVKIDLCWWLSCFRYFWTFDVTVKFVELLDESDLSVLYSTKSSLWSVVWQHGKSSRTTIRSTAWQQSFFDLTLPVPQEKKTRTSWLKQTKQNKKNETNMLLQIDLVPDKNVSEMYLAINYYLQNSRTLWRIKFFKNFVWQFQFVLAFPAWNSDLWNL